MSKNNIGRPFGSKNKRRKSDCLKVWTNEEEIEFIDKLPPANYARYKESIQLRTNWGTLSRWRILDYLGVV